MKKTIRICTLLLAAALLLSMTAFAADAPDQAGIYQVKLEDEFSGLTVEVLKPVEGNPPEVVAAVDAEIGGTAVKFYPEGVMLRFTLTGLVEGSQQLILGLSEKSAPKEANIQYINQDSVTGGSVTFTIYPKNLKGPIYVKLANSEGMKDVLSFAYFNPHEPGDVNGDKKVNNRDAQLLFRYVSGIAIEGYDKDAMDVNGDGKINNRDAQVLFRYVSGMSVTLV